MVQVGRVNDGLVWSKSWKRVWLDDVSGVKMLAFLYVDANIPLCRYRQSEGSLDNVCLVWIGLGYELQYGSFSPAMRGLDAIPITISTEISHMMIHSNRVELLSATWAKEW